MLNAKITKTLLVKIAFLIICFLRAKIIKTCSFEKDIFVIMKYYYQILVSLILFASSFAQTQAQASGEVYRVVKSSNGQSFLLNTNGTGGTTYTDVYFRMGTIYEFDSTSGTSLILSRVINSRIEAELKANPGKQVKFSGGIEPEQISFHFESGMADLDFILGLINDKIIHPKFDDEGLEEAKTEIRADLDSLKTQESYKIQSKIDRKVWGNDYKKLNSYGDQLRYLHISAAEVKAFHAHYFLPFNNSVSVLGNFNDKDVLDKLQNAFKDYKSREFNPELITKVIDFKPVINSIQILSIASDNNLATVTYQNPGARQDRSSTYSAYIVSQLINDPDGRIQKAAKQAGLKKLKAVYDCRNFYGTLTLSAQPADSNLFDAFNHLTQIIIDFSTKNYFKEGELEKAQKNIEIEYKSLKTGNPKAYMSMVTRYRFSNDENYFSTLSDSIKTISVGQMERYVNDYFAEHSGVKCLYTSTEALKSVVPDQQYFALDESVSDIVFTYDLNKTDIETDDAKLNLKRVIQWLRINPDMHVQINGFADEGEFTKSYDDSVLRFIDSTATFHKAMPDATKKGYLRIEFMRAMKVAKALYEAGIGEDRIQGTSMVFTSETKEAAAINRKCTLTFEKIKQRITLYEYHFGKQKDTNQD